MKKILVISGLALLLTACTKNQALENADLSNAQKPSLLPTARATTKAVQEGSNSGMMKSGYKFKLAAVKNSGREGTAYISEEGGKVKVTVEMLESKAGTAAASLPAHIHVGKCPEPGAVKYALTNVENNKSETVLPTGVTVATLMDMASKDGLAINVHKSAADLKTYLTCGDLDFSNGTTMKLESNTPKSSGKASTSPKASATVKPSASSSATPAASAE